MKFTADHVFLALLPSLAAWTLIFIALTTRGCHQYEVCVRATENAAACERLSREP